MAKETVQPKTRTARQTNSRSAEHTTSTRDKPTTISDIARLAGVSKKTVSRVINQERYVNEEKRNLVTAIIKKTGFQPNPHARALGLRKSFLIAMIYDNPNAEFILNVQYGALEAMRGMGFELVVHPTDRRSPDFITGIRKFVERQQPHGVILLPPISENAEIIKTLNKIKCPHVSIAAVRIEGATHCVVSSDREACVNAALHLVALGHKHIAFITGPDGHLSANERFKGFVSGLQSRGMRISPQLIAKGGYTFESGIQVAERLLSLSPRPTAIFAANDEMAAGVYKAAWQLGISIPQQLSVMGYDDSPIASRLLPPLTTVRGSHQLMGRLAATQLINSDTSSGIDGTAFLDPTLIVRNSTQSPATEEQ